MRLLRSDQVVALFQVLRAQAQAQRTAGNSAECMKSLRTLQQLSALQKAALVEHHEQRSTTQLSSHAPLGPAAQRLVKGMHQACASMQAASPSAEIQQAWPGREEGTAAHTSAADLAHLLQHNPGELAEQVRQQHLLKLGKELASLDALAASSIAACMGAHPSQGDSAGPTGAGAQAESTSPPAASAGADAEAGAPMIPSGQGASPEVLQQLRERLQLSTGAVQRLKDVISRLTLLELDLSHQAA